MKLQDACQIIHLSSRAGNQSPDGNHLPRSTEDDLKCSHEEYWENQTTYFIGDLQFLQPCHKAHVEVVEVLGYGW